MDVICRVRPVSTKANSVTAPQTSIDIADLHGRTAGHGMWRIIGTDQLDLPRVPAKGGYLGNPWDLRRIYEIYESEIGKITAYFYRDCSL